MKPHYLYQAFNGETLLYIGITKNILKRMKDHSKASAWWNDQDKIIYTQLANEYEASTLERVLINKFRPVFNETHNRGELLLAIQVDLEALEWKTFRFEDFQLTKLQKAQKILDEYNSRQKKINHECDANISRGTLAWLEFIERHQEEIVDIYQDSNLNLHVLYGPTAFNEFEKLQLELKNISFNGKNYLAFCEWDENRDSLLLKFQRMCLSLEQAIGVHRFGMIEVRS